MKFLRIEKSLTSAENVVLTIVNHREGATLLNCEECHGIEVRAADLFQTPDIPLDAALVNGDELRDMEREAGESVEEYDMPEGSVNFGTIQGL